MPGIFYGQRSLVGYSPWGHNESDTTELMNWTKFQALFGEENNMELNFVLSLLTTCGVDQKKMKKEWMDRTHVSVEKLMDLNNTLDVGNWKECDPWSFKPVWQKEWLYLNRSREVNKEYCWYQARVFLTFLYWVCQKVHLGFSFLANPIFFFF